MEFTLTQMATQLTISKCKSLIFINSIHFQRYLSNPECLLLKTVLSKSNETYYNQVTLLVSKLELMNIMDYSLGPHLD